MERKSTMCLADTLGLTRSRSLDPDLDGLQATCQHGNPPTATHQRQVAKRQVTRGDSPKKKNFFLLIFDILISYNND